MTTPTHPDFSNAQTLDQATDPARSGVLAAAYALAQELRALDPSHDAAFGLRRGVALLATDVLVSADARPARREAQRLLNWLDHLPDADPETVWLRVL